jgi:hypothetical protein
MILNPIKRRTKSRYADDKAVDDFARVAKAHGLPLDCDDKRLAWLRRLKTFLAPGLWKVPRKGFGKHLRFSYIADVL